MNDRQRVYLDHAATSWPKSDEVVAAISQCTAELGAAGRGLYRSALDADRHVRSVRREIARLIGAAEANGVSLHTSGTAALNAAIHGCLRPGDHVVSTCADHNSVLRPLAHWQKHHQVEVTYVSTDGHGQVAAGDVVAAVRPSTRMVAMTHASNVTGAVQDVQSIGEHLNGHGAIFLVDAAQTFGYLPINVVDWHVDLLAAPGHKGSGGPLGTGFLYASEQVQQSIQPTIQGGTGSQSESLEMPSDYPAKLEAGNLNVPALAGWTVALKAVQRCGIEAIHRRLCQMSQKMHDALQLQNVKLFSKPGALAIASLCSETSSTMRLSSMDLAGVLDSEFGVEVRAGFHCAALIHECLGSPADGILRLSGGYTTTDAEIEFACRAIAKIVSASCSE